MAAQVSSATLADLDAIAYLDEGGQIPSAFDGKVGLYAIFDVDRVLQYIGFSRDVGVGLKQHLVRQPTACHWVKVQPVSRPSRTLLEEMRQAWIAENGAIPSGNQAGVTAWEKPIDAKLQMTDAEKAALDKLDGIEYTKHLKKVSRRVQAEVLEVLKGRGAQMDLRFNPKLKEQGLLDLKS